MFLSGNWDTATFVTNYLPFALFPILYVGARIYYRQSPVKAEDMDFVSGLAEIEAAEYVRFSELLSTDYLSLFFGSHDEPPPKNKVEAFWQWLVRLK